MLARYIKSETCSRDNAKYVVMSNNNYSMIMARFVTKEIVVMLA